MTMTNATQPRKTSADRVAEKLAAFEAKSPAEKAAYFARVDAKADADEARRRNERDARDLAESLAVDCLDWANAVLDDPHACPRLRKVAIGLHNEDYIAGSRFLAPEMTEAERTQYDLDAAMGAVVVGRASVRPALIGWGLIVGLSEHERTAVLCAVCDARDAETARLFGSASHDHCGDIRVERAGDRAGKLALTKVLAFRPRPDPEASPIGDTSDASWLAPTVPGVDSLASPLSVYPAPVCGGSPARPKRFRGVVASDGPEQSEVDENGYRAGSEW